MALSKTISNDYKERAIYDRLYVNNLKSQNVAIRGNENNSLPPKLINMDVPINDLIYVGINMKPCEYCKTNIGYHYHDLNKTTKWDNWIDNKHVCKYCKENPGAIHIHTNN